METPSPETRAQRAIESFGLGHFVSLRSAALALEVPVSTVYHRVAGRPSNAHKSKNQLALLAEEEKVLIEWIFQLHRLGVPARPSRVRGMAEHIRRTRTGADVPPLGKNWVTKFTKRHPEIKSVIGARLDKER